MGQFSAAAPTGFARPETWEVRVPTPEGGNQHNAVIANFVEAILDGTPLIAPAAEGIHSVELANAMIYSSLQQEKIQLPLDSAAYEAKLKELIATSKYVKPAAPVAAAASDFSRSFGS